MWSFSSCSHSRVNTNYVWNIFTASASMATVDTIILTLHQEMSRILGTSTLESFSTESTNQSKPFKSSRRAKTVTSLISSFKLIWNVTNPGLVTCC